ncbi:hypothetical protein [Alkalicoccus chagannorensis]|uniref:hypothetical protein n=1 Tax=Alkalicoccus chagannorensis TaxID=427072 RepID=UPI000411BAB6|nr:hypothetical protein [Alkalicoccus chagannorensis]
MDIQSFYERKARTHILLTGLEAAGTIGLVFILYILNWPAFQHWYPALALPFSIPVSIILALTARRRAANIRLQVPERPAAFQDQHRLILVPFVHWLKEYVFFTMQGEAVAVVREDVHGWKKAGTFLLHLIGLRRWLAKRLVVTNAEALLYTLQKEAGWKQRYHLFDADGKKQASYEMNLWNLKRQYSTIYDAGGEKVAENEGGFAGIHFSVVDLTGDRLVDIKYDGIPLEAMNLFAGVKGDILTLQQELGEEAPVYLFAPLLVQLHYTR